MYYFYCYDGYIYHDSTFLNFIKTSKSSKSEGGLEGDIITMFVDQEEWKVAWYINNRYVGAENIDLKHRTNLTRLYPFIEITTKGDEIQLLQ